MCFSKWRFRHVQFEISRDLMTLRGSPFCGQRQTVEGSFVTDVFRIVLLDDSIAGRYIFVNSLVLIGVSRYMYLLSFRRAKC